RAPVGPSAVAVVVEDDEASGLGDLPGDVPPQVALLAVVLALSAAPSVHGQDRSDGGIGLHDLDAPREAVVLEATEQLLDDRLEATARPFARILVQERDREARPHQSPSVRSTSLTCWMPVWWAMKKRSASSSVKFRQAICSRP